MNDNNQSTLFKLNFDLSFDEAIRDLRSEKNRKMRKGSQNYWVLYALFCGDVIDDYDNKPRDNEDKEIHNIKTRISDLTNKYNIKIEREFEKNYKKYWIAR